MAQAIFHFREDEAILERAQKKAESEGTTLSSVLRGVIRSWLKGQLPERRSMSKDYEEVLPIDGMTFQTTEGTWKAVVRNWPIPPQNSTVLLYEIEFHGPSVRHLKLWVPGEIEAERRQPEAVADVQRWLEGADRVGEIRSCFA